MRGSYLFEVLVHMKNTLKSHFIIHLIRCSDLASLSHKLPTSDQAMVHLTAHYVAWTERQSIEIYPGCLVVYWLTLNMHHRVLKMQLALVNFIFLGTHYSFCKCVVLTPWTHVLYINDWGLFHPIPILWKWCDQPCFPLTWSDYSNINFPKLY